MAVETAMQNLNAKMQCISYGMQCCCFASPTSLFGVSAGVIVYLLFALLDFCVFLFYTFLRRRTGTSFLQFCAVRVCVFFSFRLLAVSTLIMFFLFCLFIVWFVFCFCLFCLFLFVSVVCLSMCSCFAVHVIFIYTLPNYVLFNVFCCLIVCVFVLLLLYFLS